MRRRRTQARSVYSVLETRRGENGMNSTKSSRIYFSGRMTPRYACLVVVKQRLGTNSRRLLVRSVGQEPKQKIECRCESRKPKAESTAQAIRFGSDKS